MSAIASSSKHAKQVRYKCSLCKERGHKRKFCPTRAASVTQARKNKPPLRTQPQQPRQRQSHPHGVIGDRRRLPNTTTQSETQKAATVPATALTIADIEFEKMCKEIGMRVTKQPPLKKSNRRVSFAAEPTVIKVAKLHENREEREQLWWPAANRQLASLEKCRETFWKRDSLYRWTIEKDVWNLYAQTVLKSTSTSASASTLPPPYNKSFQPDRGLY